MAEEADKAKDSMLDFVREVEREKSVERAAVRSTPKKYDIIQQSFTASPMTRIKSSAPLGRRSGGGKPAEAVDAASLVGSSFCSINEVPAASGDYYITGGSVHAGNKNFNVPDFLVDSTDDAYLVYVVVNVEAYRTDDGDYFLNGIETSSDTSLVMVDTTASDYPDNTDPDVSDGLGIIHLPVGSVNVVSGVPTFVPTGCGTFHIGQCGGALSYGAR